MLQGLAQREVEVVDIGLRRPTLDDVFLSLTGHHSEDEEAGAASPKGSRKNTNKKKKEAVR